MDNEIKKITIILSILALLLDSCATSKKNPIDYSSIDAILIDKYLVDTVDFQRLEKPFHIDGKHSSIFWNNSKDWKGSEKIFSKIQKKRNKYPKTKINNINDVHQWLVEIIGSYNPWRGSYSCCTFSYYKQVDDGFLIQNRLVSYNTYRRSCRQILYKMYLVGYDHNILEINKWTIDPCPNKPYGYVKNIEIHFPELENAEVRYPELSNGSINGFLLEHLCYPVVAFENGIQGKVIMAFIIEIDGSISNVEIVKKVDPSLDKEAERCIKLTNGKWISGVKNGEQTLMEIKAEIDFSINLGDYKNFGDFDFR
ncbi:MAG: energy transducer TonB [Bacteroidales bacterium]|nr:energy transducer TonB [Bacteroidales bacterium]